jgi:hypothetical protein
MKKRRSRSKNGTKNTEINCEEINKKKENKRRWGKIERK